MTAQLVAQITQITGWSSEELSRLLRAGSRDSRQLAKLGSGRRGRIGAQTAERLAQVSEILSQVSETVGGDTGAVRETLYARSNGPSIYDHLAVGDYTAARKVAEIAGKAVEPEDADPEPVRITAGHAAVRRPLWGGKKTMFVRRRGAHFESVIRVGSVVLERYTTPVYTTGPQVGDIYVARVEKVFDEFAFCDVGDISSVFVSGDEMGVPAGRTLREQYKPGDVILLELRSMGNPEQGKGPSGTARYTLAGNTVTVQAAPGGGAEGVIVTRGLVGTAYQEAVQFAAGLTDTPDWIRIVIHDIGGTEVWSRELHQLLARFTQVQAELANPTPRRVYEVGDGLTQVIRDRCNYDTTIVVEGDQGVWEAVVKAAGTVGQVQRWNPEHGDMFEASHLTTILETASSRVVELKNGGNLVFDQVEAGMVVDVNTAGADREQTNKAAAREIARQIRLRDLGGMVIVDFAGGGFDRNGGEEMKELSNILIQATQDDPGRVRVFYSPETYIAHISRRRSNYGTVPADEKAYSVSLGEAA